jgi:hypothetical protein
MYVEVPGGQQVYLAPDGSLSYTIAHSANIPRDAVTKGFKQSPQKSATTIGSLIFNDDGFMACPADDEVYQIYAAGGYGFFKLRRTDCVGINLGTSQYGGAPAWQYD